MTPGWQSLITTSINMDGRLLFLLNRNYSVEKLDRTIPFFYREILDCFQELRNNYEDPWKRKFILWNNRDINIQTNRPFGRPGGIKMLFFFLCKTCWTIKVFTYLSPQEFIDNITSVHLDLGDLNSICENFDFPLFKDITINLKKLSATSFIDFL